MSVYCKNNRYDGYRRPPIIIMPTINTYDFNDRYTSTVVRYFFTRINILF